MLKLLIFDLDGTLTDTAQDITDAINYSLRPFSHKIYSVEETKAMVGSGISKLLESLLPEKDDISKRSVTDRFLEYYADHLLDNTRTYPHVQQTLSELKGYKKAVVSNKREILSKAILDGLGISTFFDIIFGSDSVPEKKPSPVPMMKLLKIFNVTSDQALIIGDSNYDIESGKAAGIKTVAVTYGFRSKDVLKNADFIIDGFNELLNVITQINETQTDRNS